MQHHHHHHHSSCDSSRQSCNGENNDDTYYQYAAQNNLGVMRLRQKRYLDAANCFCQAVKYVNERSVYYCPRHGADPRNCSHDCRREEEEDNSNDEYNSNHNLRQRQSPLLSPPQSQAPSTSTDSSTSSNHQGINFQRWSLPASNVVSSETELRYPPPNNKIKSFYLLLDEEHGGRNATDSGTNSSSATHQPLCNNNNCNASEAGQKQCCVDNNSCGNDHPKQTSSCTSSSSNTTTQSQQQHEGTYVFRNPILVSKRGGIYPTASNGARENRPTPGNINNSNTIDKATCASLSLISVYNMALTYHLAALDSDGISENNSREATDDHDNRKRNRDRSTRTNEVASTALKRQKVSHCSNDCNISPTTARTPFGEKCDAQYDNDDSKRKQAVERPSTTSSKNTASASVDRVLLDQALAYYQIAYRILVSEQRVLISQAMVILNNIGHIHRLMGREDLAKKYFQRLLTTMVYLQQTGDQQQISHWDSFLTNVLDLIVSPEDSHKKFAPAA